MDFYSICRPRYGKTGSLSKIFLIMRLTFFIVIVAGCLQVSASGYAQGITMSVKNAPLEEVFKQLNKQSGYLIWYEDSLLDAARPVNVNLNKSSVTEALEACLKDQPLSYEIVGKTIVIKAKLLKRILERVIKGVVSDSIGPIPGATVKLKGNTKVGGNTDIHGRFAITVPDDNAILVVSMVGYITQEIPVEKAQELNIILKPEVSTLDDVVVVAFGTQKRTDMVGSVTSVKPASLKVPSSNLTTALAGRVPGMIAFQRSGEPGQDNANFFIRGVTTFGYKTTPLILIDGVELTTTDLARLSPDDIASFSIMKDATSTALYGARGANGVIAVTTKQGAVGKAKLSFRLESSVSSPTREVELADPVTYMRMANEAALTRDPTGLKIQPMYSDEKIANTGINGSNPFLFPANDWREIMFKSNTLNQRANLNVSGGGGVARYYVSGSFNKDNGVMKVDKKNNFNNNIDLKSYTLRSNVDIDITKSTQLTVRLNGNFDDYTGPITGGADMYRLVMRSNPVLFPAYYPVDSDHQFVRHIMFGNASIGSSTGPDYMNPYAEMTKGYKESSRSLMLAQLEVKQDLKAITEGLTWNTMMNTNRTSYFDVSRFYNPYYYELGGYDVFSNQYRIDVMNETTATEYLGYTEGPKQLSSVFYLQSIFNYNRNFKKHGLSGMVVYMMQQNLSANAGNLQLSLPFRNLGVSGRATYNYDSRYYAEFNFGYNGSERFYQDKRFGFFPSAGVAWSVSNEKFFEPLKPIITSLRLRATYGLICNDAIGAPEDRFFYLSNVDMNAPSRFATFGRGDGATYSLNGVLVSRYSNPDITWETSKKKNLALELSLFNDLNIKAEYFSEKRENILMTRASIPTTMGFSAPIRSNVGKASGRGTDISLEYQKHLSNSLWLSALGNFTYAASKFEVYEEPKYKESYRTRIGTSINQQYGYIAERLFIDDEEAANSPRQNFGEYGGGDIKFTDVNGDGQITTADMVPIGNPTLPEVTYGFGLSGGYKGIDFSAFFQGLANEAFWIDPAATSPFASYRYDGEVVRGTLSNQVLKAYADSYWSEDRQDVNALWPRLSSTVNNNNAQPSTWFMRNGSFLRLKQVELGYTLPSKLQKKLRTSAVRLYVNASNLVTFSRFKLWDIEMGGNGLGYPVQKVYNIGLNVSFN